MPVQFGGYILKTPNSERKNYTPRRQPNAELIRRDIRDQFERRKRDLEEEIGEEVALEHLGFDEAQLELDVALKAEKKKAGKHIALKDKLLIYHFVLQPTRDYLTDLWLSAPPLKSAEQKERGAFTRAILRELKPGSTISEIKTALNNPILLNEYRISQLTPENQSMVRHFSNSETRKFLSEYSRDFPDLSPGHDTTEQGEFIREQLKPLPPDTSVQDVKSEISLAHFNYHLSLLPEHDQDLINRFTDLSIQKLLFDFCRRHSDDPSSRQAAFGKIARQNLKKLPPNAPEQVLEATIEKARFEHKVSRLPDGDQRLIARFAEPATQEFVSKFCVAHSDFNPKHDEAFGDYVRHKLEKRHHNIPVKSLQDAMKRWEFEYEASSMPEEDQILIGRFKNHETQTRILDFCFEHSTTFTPGHNQEFGLYVREKLAESSPELTPSKLEADLKLFKARWEKRGSRR